MGSKVRKPFALIGVLLAFALVVAACGDDEPGAGLKIGLAFDVGGRGDLSFNDLAAKAWDDGKEEFGYEGEDLEPTGGGEKGYHSIPVGEVCAPAHGRPVCCAPCRSVHTHGNHRHRPLES